MQSIHGILSIITNHPVQTFSTASAEGERWIHLVLYFNQSVQHHRTTLVQVQLNHVMSVHIVINIVKRKTLKNTNPIIITSYVCIRGFDPLTSGSYR